MTALNVRDMLGQCPKSFMVVDSFDAHHHLVAFIELAEHLLVLRQGEHDLDGEPPMPRMKRLGVATEGSRVG